MKITKRYTQFLNFLSDADLSISYGKIMKELSIDKPNFENLKNEEKGKNK